MAQSTDLVRDHYQAAIDNESALLARVAAVVDGLEPPIDARRLAPLDQFHMGGLAATVVLADRVQPGRDDLVLDAGSGLGGPARHLAATFGCRVEGVDLAPAYVAVARLLTERAVLSDRVTFLEGDLTRLPFEDARFDLVWTQHVAMNIADRAGLYRELRRVVKPGGRLVFYDPMAVAGQDLSYPMPWAQTADTSTLLTVEATRIVLVQAGFSISTLEDVTEPALGWPRNRGRPPRAGPTPA